MPTAILVIDGMTITHSAFSSSSCGMLSGTSRTSCITTPQFSRRPCSLLSAARMLELRTRQRASVTKRIMNNLTDESRAPWVSRGMTRAPGTVVGALFDPTGMVSANADEGCSLVHTHTRAFAEQVALVFGELRQPSSGWPADAMLLRVGSQRGRLP